MKVICTLFEGDHHYGLAALINSAFANGFRGKFVVGYRGGELPFWVKTLEENNVSEQEDTRSFKIREQLFLYFIALDTNSHFTNFKPDFLLEVIKRNSNISAIYYFDPDIIITAPWQMFDIWVKNGLALCEDAKSPLDICHPKRNAWVEIFKNHDIKLEFRSTAYINGGFIGLSRDEFEFLKHWQNIQEIMSTYIGGLQESCLNYQDGSAKSFELYNMFAPFSRTDQDALNIAMASSHFQFAVGDKRIMALEDGEYLMPHALGSPKPWKRNHIRECIRGRGIRTVDKEYIKFSETPIKLYSRLTKFRKKMAIYAAGLFNRFYSK